jgi:predicted PurR-regulated permease PerM
MASLPARRTGARLGNFAKRVLLVLLLGGLALAAWRLADLAILLFGAVLMAVGLRAASRRLGRATGIGDAAGLAVVVVLLLAVLGAAFWFFGTVVADQVDEVARQVPAGLRLLVERLEPHPSGRYVLAQARGVGAAGAAGWVAPALAAVARSLTRGLGFAVLTFFVAIYLAAQPGRYRRICLRLIPRIYRRRTERLFDETADVLRRWLLGQLVVMVTIGALSGIGLWALGIKAAFALGLLGGLLTFIPYIGAVLAAVPASLVALTQGPVYTLMVVLMYVGIHLVEGNLVTPLVQAEATSLPPVLALLSTVAFSILFGPPAVLLAAPLTLLLMVAVEVLYVEPALAEPPALPGYHTQERPRALLAENDS